MDIIVLGINHNSAPVEIRERFFIPESKLGQAISVLKNGNGISGCAIISTCNRTEIYVQGNRTAEALSSFLSHFSQLPHQSLQNYTYQLSGSEAVEHIMRVASGLDSMIIGETQVLGQVKKAFEIAQQNKFTGPILNALFNRAISAGKRARAETEISEGAVSVSSAAVELAGKIFEDLAQHSVLIIGAGETSELVVRHLLPCGVKTILVSNRTFDKAKELARSFGGEAVRFDDILEQLLKVDIVISGTGAPHLLLKKEEVVKVMQQRRGRPIFFVDIAVPRDIDPAVSELEDVFLYDIDDLGKIVSENKRVREKEIPKIEQIISEEKEKFIKWYKMREEKMK